MFDRHGWPLEVGDRVTISSPCSNVNCLHGRYGVIQEVGDELVEINLIDSHPKIEGDRTISALGTSLEYGHVGITPGVPSSPGSRDGIERAMVIRITSEAVDKNLLTKKQASRIVDHWCARKESSR